MKFLRYVFANSIGLPGLKNKKENVLEINKKFYFYIQILNMKIDNVSYFQNTFPFVFTSRQTNDIDQKKTFKKFHVRD